MQLHILVEKFQQKDTIAFEALYNMYGKSIHGVIYNIVRDHTIADEILQDVFVKVWNDSSNYSTEKGRFFTWLLNVSRKAALDKVLSKKNNLSENNKHSFSDIIDNNEYLNTETDGLGIKEFVSKLANSCIDVIELIYFRGYNQKEASESLDMPISTIKTRNRNCMMQLRLMLDI